MFCILIVAMITQLYTIVTTRQTTSFLHILFNLIFIGVQLLHNVLSFCCTAK